MTGWLVETLAATTLLMVAVLALRGPVRRAFGPSVAYALWALPLLRMLLPPLPGDWQPSGLVSALLAPLVKSAVVGIPGSEQLSPAVTGSAPVSVDVIMIDAPMQAALAPTTAASGGPSMLLMLLTLWMVGMLAFLVYQLVSYRRFCTRIERQARRRQRVADDRVELIETDAAAGPLAFGIWRKVVAFPSDFAERYDEDERELALTHELTHHARGDLIANWAALVVLGIHWFNPIAWRAFRAFRADQEMACDHRVLAGKGAAFAHAYGRAIVKSAHGGAISAACHLHTINELKGRLRMLSTNRKSRSRVLAGSVGVLALGIGSLVVTASGVEAASAVRTVTPPASAAVAPATLIAAAIEPVAALAGPQDKALADLPAPPAPPTAPLPPVPGTATLPPSAAPQAADMPSPPPLPPVPPSADTPGRIDKQVVIVRNGSGKPSKHVRVIVRSPDGRVISDDTRGFEINVPEIADGDCLSGQGNGKTMVWNEDKGGKHRIIICRNRIEKMASLASVDAARAAREAARAEVDAVAIERQAYQSALAGLRTARANMASRGGGNAEGLKAIDEAIAEVEADLAKLK